METSTLLFVAAVIFYIMGIFFFCPFLFKNTNLFSKVSIIITGSGFILHSASLSLRFLEMGYLPLVTLFESLSFFAWGIILLYLIMNIKYRIGISGLFVIPVVLLILIYALFSPKGGKELDPILRSFWLGIHIPVIFLGYAAFTMAFVSGVMYLLQEKYLKSKKVGTRYYYRLPSLEVLDDVNYKSITVGFLFLTFGIIAGAIWLKGSKGVYLNSDPKVVWSLITWVLYSILLHVRYRSRMRGRKVAILSIIGFGLVIFTFLGVNFLLPGLHSFF